MDHFKLKSLATLGLMAGAMVGTAHADCTPPTTAQMNSLFTKLDPAHQDMFNNMDCEGQNLAMQLANQSCKGQNSCAGLNSCATQKNSCAGQGSCKGSSPGPFKDKNKAVEAAQNHMASKRAATMGS